MMCLEPTTSDFVNMMLSWIFFKNEKTKFAILACWDIFYANSYLPNLLEVNANNP